MASNPTATGYEVYLLEALVRLSEKSMTQSREFKDGIRAALHLSNQEPESSGLRRIVEPYLAQLGQLITSEQQKQDVLWLTLTSMAHAKWSDASVFNKLKELCNRTEIAFAVGYQMHCSMKNNLDGVPQSRHKNLWLLMLVEIMNKFQIIAECDAVKAFYREIEIKMQHCTPTVWKPE